MSAEYYTIPQGNAAAQQGTDYLTYLAAFVDGFVAELFAGAPISVDLKIFFAIFGPVSTSQYLEEVISSDGTTITLQGNAQQATQTFIITQTTQAAVGAAIAAFLAPEIASVVATGIGYAIARAFIGGVEAVAAQFIYNNFTQPPQNPASAYLDPPDQLVLLNSSGQPVFVGTYSLGIDVSEIVAVENLIDAANDKQLAPAFNSFIQFYHYGQARDGYNLLAPGTLQTIATDLSQALSTVQGWMGVNASSQQTADQNLFVQYQSLQKTYDILQQGCQIGLVLPNGTTPNPAVTPLPASDILINGVSIDVPQGNAQPGTVVEFGSGNNNYLNGSSFNNVYAYGGMGFANKITGGSGVNILWASTPNDYASPTMQTAGDTIYGGTGSNVIFGSSGNDLIFGGPGSNTIFGGEGQETIHGGDGKSGTDTIWSGLGADTIWAGDGNDTIYSGTDAGQVDSNGNTIYAGAGTDTIGGGSGDDTFYNGTGTATFYGGGGTNTLNFKGDSKTPVVLTANGGGDTGTSLTYTLTEGSAVDTLNSVQKIQFYGTGDTLKIVANTDLSGLQTIDGGSGANTLDLSSANQTFDFQNNSLQGSNTVISDFKKVILSGKDQNATPTAQYTEVDGSTGTYHFYINNWPGTIYGGTGTAYVQYNIADPSAAVVSPTNGVDGHGNPIIDVTDTADEFVDKLSAITEITLGSDPQNRVTVNGAVPNFKHDPLINLDATGAGDDVVDFSQDNSDIYLSTGGNQNAVEVYSDSNFTQDTNLGFTNFNTLLLGNGDNKVQLYAAADPYLQLVQTGNGNNSITSDVVNLTIDLGTGNNIVGSVAQGTVVNAQPGSVDQFTPSADELITGSTAQDQVVVGGIVLHGAIGEIGSQDPWVVASNGVRYSHYRPQLAGLSARARGIPQDFINASARSCGAKEIGMSAPRARSKDAVIAATCAAETWSPFRLGWAAPHPPIPSASSSANNPP